MAVISSFGTSTLNVEQDVVRVSRADAEVLIHLAKLILLNIELDDRVGIERVRGGRVETDIHSIQDIVSIRNSAVMILKSEGCKRHVDKGTVLSTRNDD